MEKGYFVRIGRGIADELERNEKLGALEALLGQLGAKSVRRYESISTVYGVITEESAERLSGQGYLVEPENVFRALPLRPSQPPR